MAFESRLDSGVYGKLASLRAALRVHLVGRGLCWVVLALVATVFVTLAADYSLRLDRAQRALIMAVVAGSVAYIVWRWLVRPLRVPMNDEEMALLMEDYHPELDDRLISALQFVENPASRVGASETLIGKVVAQANALADRISSARPVAGKGTWKRAAWSAGAVGLLVVFAAFNTKLMVPWLMRNVLFQNVDYPRQTILEVVGGPTFNVVAGEDLAVTCTARTDGDHVVPDAVTFHMSFAQLGSVDETVRRPSRDSNQFVKVFEAVSDPFTFYVTGNDGRTEKCQVTVGARPELEDVTFTLSYPGYMGRDSSVITAEHGVLPIPAGSTIALSARATKPLVSAKLMLNDQLAAEMRVAPPSKDKAPDPRELDGTIQLPDSIESPTLMLRFVLKDVEGIENQRGAVYSLRIDPDNPPTVNLNRRAVRGEVTANAIIPLLLNGHDDYGMSGLGVLASVVIDPPTTTQPDPPEVAAAGVTVGQRNVQIEHPLDVAAMKVQVGQIIRVQAVGRDTLPASFGGPNAARSVVQTFKVVSREELEEELLRRQREVSEDFARALLTEGAIRSKVKGARDRAAAAGGVPEVELALTEAAGEQRRVAAQCVIAAQQLQGVLDEMQANRVGIAEEMRKLAVEVIAPLEEISKKPMNDIADAMDRASKEKDRATLTAFGDQAAGAIDGIYSRMEQILKSMKQIESRQELANRLKSLIKVAEDITHEIEKIKQRQEAGVLDSTTKPKPEPEK